MENKNQQNDLILNEIGYLAKIRDAEMTILERMKIKRATKYHIVGAITIYSITMLTFTILLP